MTTRRRVTLRLPDDLHDGIRRHARARGIGLAPAIRLLVAEALAAGGTQPAAALAGLVAAEHAVLMVATVLPEGERRMRETAGRAVTAAQERLAIFEPEGSR